MSGIAFLVIVGIMLAPTSAMAGTFPGINGRLIITDISGPAYHLTSTKPDGTDVKSVLSGGTSRSDVEYSPDGTKITYVQSVSSTQQVFTAKADGTNALQITAGTEHAYTPSWSPDGTKILYVQSVSGNKRIFRMNADGTSQTQLTSSAPYSDPEYSPDGTKIVAVLEGVDDEIAIMNADGSSIVALTSNAVQDHKASWSPDGTKLIYSSVVSGLTELFTMNPDGSNKTQLTSDGKGYHAPEFSPDGTKITFIDTLAPSLTYVAKADGTNITEVPVGWGREVSWQTLTHLPSSLSPNPTISVSGGKATVNIPSLYTDSYEGIDNATVSVTSTPALGNTTVDSATGIITYTPKTVASSGLKLLRNFLPTASAAGTDSFTYRVCSLASSSLCSTGTVTVSLLTAPKTGFGQPSRLNFLTLALGILSLSCLVIGIGWLRRNQI